MEMKASRNTIRLHRPVDVSSPWEDVKEWARRNVTNEKVAEVDVSQQQADGWHDDIVHQRFDDSTESRTDDDAHGHVHHVSAHGELLELL